MQRPLSVISMLLLSNGLPATSSAPSVFQAFLELPEKMLEAQPGLPREQIIGSTQRTEKREMPWGEANIEVRKNVNTQYLSVFVVQPGSSTSYTLRAFNSSEGRRVFLVQKQHCYVPGCDTTILVVEKQGKVWKDRTDSLLPALTSSVLAKAYMETTGKTASEGGEELDYHLQMPEEGNAVEVWNRYDERMFSLSWTGQKFVIRTKQ
ncbi:hypothetical protein [Deinococcus cellulosilyticus]|uniref:Uncharacterized protein n=1 Tax=Deinococcus cellulosilyticus (strain DSM 18568 / NBRC 106333 / KACC 11606 / 5516J-15) TaxID=1223518 RepID=A0A511N4U4_DEIC1|nr:hypothetical protein [Deinococcus cellulosilyticus]GEM47431.1 hypothetical protein DC3_30660 [Deinococcus cellulosilyticus NBRC 106333 = KACC 11606]